MLLLSSLLDYYSLTLEVIRVLILLQAGYGVILTLLL